MIIDFTARAMEKAAQPHFDVGFLPFQSVHQPVQILGKYITVANGAVLDQPVEEGKKTISSDELFMNKNGLEYFRYLALSVMERLVKDDPTVWQAPDPTSKRNEDFLRPIFNGTLQRGVTLLTALREMQNAKFPIPEEFIVFLPHDEYRREEITRALVPFKHAQRAAIDAARGEDTVAFRITHVAAKTASLILN